MTRESENHRSAMGSLSGRSWCPSGVWSRLCDL